LGFLRALSVGTPIITHRPAPSNWWNVIVLL